jgi:hypothetical protein
MLTLKEHQVAVTYARCAAVLDVAWLATGRC